MSIRKIGKEEPICRDPEHNVPSHIVLENGVYEHTCPGCKRKKVFRVNRPTF